MKPKLKRPQLTEAERALDDVDLDLDLTIQKSGRAGGKPSQTKPPAPTNSAPSQPTGTDKTRAPTNSAPSQSTGTDKTRAPTNSAPSQSTGMDKTRAPNNSGQNQSTGTDKPPAPTNSARSQSTGTAGKKSESHAASKDGSGIAVIMPYGSGSGSSMGTNGGQRDTGMTTVTSTADKGTPVATADTVNGVSPWPGKKKRRVCTNCKIPEPQPKAYKKCQK